MRKVRLFLSGMLLVFGAATAATSESVVQSLRIQNDREHSRIVFDLSADTTRKIFLLNHPDRVVIDLQHARLATKIRKPRSSNPIFGAIRIGRRNDHDLRIVLDLKQKVETKSQMTQTRQGHRLVLDLFASTSAKKSKKPASEKNLRLTETDHSKPRTTRNPRHKNTGSSREASEPGPAESTTRETRNSAKSHQSRADAPISVGPKNANELVVAIDAGHGGSDPGAKGNRGTWEKDVVLSIAKKLTRLIAREPEMRAVLIRDGDYFLALRKRMRLARAANADLFVSIHADANPQLDIRGSSVYTLSQKGASSEAARWLAARENESDRLGGVRLDDKDDMLAEVLLDLSQTATLDASARLADEVLDNLRELGKVHRRTVQSAGFAVLKSPDIPSILVETAFISNPHEERKLGSSAYQDQLA
ncbi:MAG: N-acetylmuramoyl-L-alanine amidase, partial [Methylococcales bacterium]